MTNTKTQDIQDFDWDQPFPGGDSIYLRLSSKGESVRIRMVGRPIQFIKRFKDAETGETKEKWSYANKVIFRNRELKENQIKGFEFGAMVGKLIQDLHKNEDWGNPENYDLEITRTEEKGKYYTVVPKPPTPLTDEEKELVLNSDIDIYKMYAPKESDSSTDPFAD